MPVLALDTVTWHALGALLTLLGLVASAFVWRRRGAAHGMRWTAWSLVPLAAALTGTLRLAGEVFEAVLRWAARLVFSPTVWLGIVVASVAVVLYVVSGFLLRRTTGRAPDTGTTPPGPPAVGSRRSGEPAIDDLDDIEAILRKHGIS